MRYAETILDLVGRTPLVRINKLTRDLGPADRQPLLLAKLEMLNPGGSVKDRIGLRQHGARPRDRGCAEGLSMHLRDGRQAVSREAAASAGVRRRGRPVPD